MGDLRSSASFDLRPCRTSASHGRASEDKPLLTGKAGAKERSLAASEKRGGLGGRKGWILKQPMRKERRRTSMLSSSASFSGGERREEEEEDGRCLEELGLPLGISFAAVIAQVWDEKKIPADRLSKICVTAVKKAVADVHGGKYEYFLGNFEKSFCSTMNTLQFTRGESTKEGENLSQPSSSSSRSESVSFLEGPETSDCVEEIPETQSRTMEYIEEIHLNQPRHTSEHTEEIQDDQSSNQDRQMVLTSESTNQQLMPISGGSSQVLGQAILTSFEKLAVEQARSNELKAFKLGLTCQRMKMKETEISLSSESNALEQKKLSVGLKEAQFKEDKLKMQMKDLKHGEFVGKCVDLLVAGLFLMSMFLGYAAWVYSYKRIVEATEACMPPPKGSSSSWFIPKQVSSLNDGFIHLRCHAVVLSRMSFGILMILAVAYSLFQRSASPKSTMPVTFILLMLGCICGVAGKFCIDTLGGDGYRWLMHWETLCFLHFIVNAFPSFIHPLLYGQVYDYRKPSFNLLPYWLRRLVFFGTLLLVLPMLGGLLPFAPVNDWKDHFTELVLVQMRVGDEEL